MILTIDTSKSEEIEISIIKGKRKIVLKDRAKSQKAQKVLFLISKLFQDYKLKLSDLRKIKVKTGPGSFTGLRVGIAVANTLSFALGIPVNEKNVGDIELPKY